MKALLSRLFVPALGLGIVLTAVSCSSTGKVKDEGAYTTTTKPPAATPGQKSAGTVGGSVGVFVEKGSGGESSRSVR
ncbi:MAG: hypothetical protein ACAI34_24085 [Verrucomicrobium sp.]|nr:hypothetical protein [Verrucomicrobium sp.]